MKKRIFILTALAAFFMLGFFLRPILCPYSGRQMVDADLQKEAGVGKVSGVAGVFFKSNDPEKLKKWYSEQLGMKTDAYGSRFVWTENCDTSREESLQWSLFARTDSYFEPSGKDFMICYRVDDLQKLSVKLRKAGVQFVDEITTYEYGSFLHIMDIDGNKIELFQPDYSFGK